MVYSLTSLILNSKGRGLCEIFAAIYIKFKVHIFFNKYKYECAIFLSSF